MALNKCRQTDKLTENSAGLSGKPEAAVTMETSRNKRLHLGYGARKHEWVRRLLQVGPGAAAGWARPGDGGQVSLFQNFTRRPVIPEDMCEPPRRVSVGRDMLEESVSGLRSTMCELQERLNSVDGEGTYIRLIQG